MASLVRAIREQNWQLANRLVAESIQAKLSDAFARERRTLIGEASVSSMPVNWQKGWTWPWQIGAGGKEVPYLKDGRWKLYVFNAQERKHYIYDFDTDMFEVA